MEALTHARVPLAGGKVLANMAGHSEQRLLQVVEQLTGRDRASLVYSKDVFENAESGP